MEAAKALGETGTDLKAAEALLSMNESHYWQVRNAALYGLKRMIERGVLKPGPELLSMTSSFILTSTDFRPHFQVKETYAALWKRSTENDESEGHSLGAPASSDRVARKIP